MEGDLVLGDMGQGLPFRAGSFDGAISISALQWLCNADKKAHNPIKRLNKFFATLYAVLVSYFKCKENPLKFFRRWQFSLLNLRIAVVEPYFNYIPKHQNK